MLQPSSLLQEDSKLVDNLCSDLSKLVIHSKTNSTWTKHISAWKLYDSFILETAQDSWNMDIFKARKFVVWALNTRNLKPDTVKTYLYSVRLAHVLKNVPCENFSKDDIIKMSLKGANNLQLLNESTHSIRAPMTLNALLILGHRISETQWKNYSKQTVWTVFAISFFTSCRVGELLSPFENSFDPKTTVQWKHVNFFDDYATIFVPFTKTKGLRGHVLEIFPFKIKSCCPFSALSNLLSLAKENKTYSANNPVFSFRSGKFVTINKLNSILATLLSDFCEDKLVSFTCHSFRAAIPSLLSSHPDKSFVSDISDWGEWASPSFNLYTKLDHSRKKFLFWKISTLLCENDKL